jgi:soluble lytic murein transglycosylase-like protein
VGVFVKTLLLLVATSAYSYSDHSGALPTQEIANIIIGASAEHGIPYDIAYRLASWESGYDVRATNKNKNGTVDKGLFMLNSRWLKEFAIRYNGGSKIDPFNPVVNARVAMAHLANLYRVTGKWRLALAAYNCGLKRMREGDWPKPTMNLVNFVLDK